MNEETTKKATKGKPPVKKIRVGNIQVQFWENVTKTGQTVTTITLQRAYRDPSGNFKYTYNLQKNDISKAIRALQLAFDDFVGIQKVEK